MQENVEIFKPLKFDVAPNRLYCHYCLFVVRIYCQSGKSLTDFCRIDSRYGFAATKIADSEKTREILFIPRPRLRFFFHSDIVFAFRLGCLLSRCKLFRRKLFLKDVGNKVVTPTRKV